jgi:hypothetical protein
MSTGTLIRTAEGQIPEDDESDSDEQVDNDETCETVIPGPDQVVQRKATNSKRRKVSQSADDSTTALLTESITQQRAMAGAVGQLTDMLRLFMEQAAKKDVSWFSFAFVY